MKRSSILVVALLAASACEVRLEGGTAGGAVTDARPGGGRDDDAGGGGDAGGGDDAPAGCANGRVVYLNFEGVTLTDAAKSDATLNRASWMTINQGTAPRYKSNAANRAQLIQDVTDGVRARLASFPVTVVTQRPAAGPYVMVVFGGDADDVGARFNGSVNELDCGDLQKSDVAWISDGVSPTLRVVNFAIGAIGFGLGLTATSDPLDCMCGWDNACVSDNSVACKLSPMIDRDPAANQRCPGLITQNEVATFDAAFCQ